VAGPHALAREGYFAGTDALRAQDLRWAIDDPRIDGIWCLRGGYGAARLLPTLSPDAIRARPKTLLGYSDITALHAAWQHAGVMSFHAPTARSVLTPFTRTSLVQTVVAGGDGCGAAPDSQVLRAGRATGRLAGGNLSLIASLCGTPWAVDFRDAIIVLEDINEATYRIDRMLTQLRLAGAFDESVAIAFGHCTDCVENTDDGEKTLDAVVREYAITLGIPALLGIPLGHIADQWTIPLGALATLDTDSKSLTVHRRPLALA
jgi:muramoyltetrapeptide carboxypeptidase